MKQAISAAKSGHGGALDDMFKSHLKNLPAGQLSNNPLMARYMPTVKERIEALQAQASEHPDQLDKTVAEIIVLRNLAHAERGKASSLKKPIPTDPENSLKADAWKLRKFDSLNYAIRETSRLQTMNLICEGHGGAMTEYFRQEARERSKGLCVSGEARAVYNANTVGGRLNRLRQDAQKLREQATESGSVTVSDKKHACELLGEYLALDKLTRDPKTNQLDESKLQTDVVWSQVDKAREAGFEKNETFRKFTESMGDDLVTGVMDDLTSKDQQTFFKELAQKMSVVMQKTQEKAPVHQQAEPTVEKAPAQKDMAAGV